MIKKNITICIAIVTLIFSAQAFAMMGGMGTGSGQNMTGQQHHRAMTSTGHDQYMSNQTGNHRHQPGQGSMGQSGTQTDPNQGKMDHDSVDHQAMGDHQMQDDAEDFFRE